MLEKPRVKVEDAVNGNVRVLIGTNLQVMISKTNSKLSMRKGLLNWGNKIVENLCCLDGTKSQQIFLLQELGNVITC